MLLLTVVIPTAVASNPAAACPVTVPNNNIPSPDLLELFRFPSAEDGYFHGDGRLWVGWWWPKGVIRSHGLEFNPDGTLSVKTPWFRSPDAAGRLEITGRRLDGEAPPLRVDVPDGYGDVGIQVSGINYPTPGCWEVTGSVQDVSLTFVVFVVFEPPFPGSAPIDASSVTRPAPGCSVTSNDADAGGLPEHVTLGFALEQSGTPPARQFPGEDEYFGGDGLWTTLWPDGIIAVKPSDVRSDGLIAVGFSWYRDEVARRTPPCRDAARRRRTAPAGVSSISLRRHGLSADRPLVPVAGLLGGDGHLWESRAHLRHPRRRRASIGVRFSRGG